MHALALVLVPPDTRDIEAAVAQHLAPYYARRAGPCQHKRYLDACELHQMRVGSGSPLLTAAIQSLKEPVEFWLP
ncbi:MAG TPA: hypothetical protein VFU49_01865, partial [Ktedonobacteraceae bacterium]|nr:hypothetical protein [Ktedonobacteraceae bacterium]